MARKPKTGQDAHNAVQTLMDEYRKAMQDKNFQGFEKKLMDDLKLLRVDPDGLVVFSLFLSPEFCHLGDSLHGASAALILDQCTSLAIAPHSAPGYYEWLGGVSRNLSVTCLRPAPKNSTVHARCKVVSIGRTTALLHGDITSEDEKTVFNVMSHDKLHVQFFNEKANKSKM